MHRLTLECPEWQQDWHDEEKDHPGRMTRPIFINGVMFHLEAIEVHVDPADDCQKAVNPYWETTLTDWYVAAEPDSTFETMTINGREWAIFMSPGC